MVSKGANGLRWCRLVFIVGILSASLIYTEKNESAFGPQAAEAATLARPHAKLGVAVGGGNRGHHRGSRPAHRQKSARPRQQRPSPSRQKPKTQPHPENPKSPLPAPDLTGRADVAAAGVTAPVVVTVLADDVDGTAARIAADISNVLDGDNMRIMTVLGKGSVRSLRDIATSPYLDLALVPADALDEAKRRGFSDVADRVTYVAPLYHQEVQILARGDITTIAQLNGKKVGIDVAESATSDRASAIFGALAIKPDMIHLDQPRALSLLQRGALEAIVFADGKPIPALAALSPKNNLHFVTIPYDAALQDSYYPAQIEAKDYPNLVTPDGKIETVSIGTILAAYNAPQGSPRYRKLAKFTQAFFRNFDDFLQPGRHPKWHEVNFAAEAPGWQRFKPAQDWLDQNQNTTATVNDTK